MAIDPETKAAMDANNAEIMAAYERLWEQQQQSLEEQKAATEGGLYTSMAFHEAGQEYENAAMYMQAWQETVNKRAEAQAQGIPPPQGMENGFLYTDQPDTDRWDALGDMFDGTKPPGT